MKTKLLILLSIFMVTFNLNAQSQSKSEKQKILVVYYSWGGNTREIATQIQSLTDGDIFEIVPETAYPQDYDACVDQAKKEINANFKPQLKSQLNTIDSYDIIFIGSPNWWSTIAPPVAAFLSDYNLDGKTVVPFITHGGGRLARCVDDMKKLSPKATYLKAFEVNGRNVKSAKSDLEKWLKDIKVTK